MSGPVRRAGTGRQPDGSVVTWSVAEGRRGRRWREVVQEGGSVVLSLLLETDPDRRFAHLELSTAAGLLTLHPEGDGTLHGNAVDARGVSHVRGLAWPADAFVLVDRSAVCVAAAIRQLDGLPGRPAQVRRAGRRACALIGLDLGVRPGSVRLEVAGERWLLDGREVPTPTEDGLPKPESGVDWPLEED